MNSHTLSPRRHYTRAQVEEIAARHRTWGEHDDRGATERVTAERVRDAAAAIRTGRVHSLAIPFDRLGPMPSRTARVNPQHIMYRHGGDLLAGGEAARAATFSTDDGVYMPLQSATQWDAFCHMFYRGVTYNGQLPETVTSEGAKRNSITSVQRTTSGRGVLLDFPRFCGVPWLEPGDAIQDDDIAACAEAQGVEIGEGDFVLIRTGHMTRCRSEPHWGDYSAGPAPGLGLSGAEYLPSRGVVAVASDTWGVEVVPYESEPELKYPVHIVLLVNAGVLIGEIWDLETLADDCAEDGIYEFFLSAAPLNITGAVGSPLNPIAIK